MTFKATTPIQACTVTVLIGFFVFLTAHAALAQQSASTPLLFLFHPVELSSSGGNAVSIAMGDVNGDGKQDLVVGNCSPDPGCLEKGSVSVLLGSGDGTFQPPLVYDAGGFGTNSLALADVNGDDKLDIVVANCGSGFNCSGFGVVGVLLGNGEGTFRPVMTYGTGEGYAEAIAIADVNADGKPDLITANCTFNCSQDGSVSALLGQGDGTFQPAVIHQVFQPGIGAWSLAIGDVNEDGKPDLVVGGICRSAPNCSNLVAVLLGNGDGTFQWWSQIALDSHEARRSSVALGDINSDGKLDILVANLDSNTVGVLLGNGDGTFQAVVTYDCRFWGNGAASSVVVRDVNGDGKPDLLVQSGGVALLLNNGDGTFQPVVTYDPPYAGPIAVGDVNQDAKPDVALVQTGGAGVLLNNFGAPPTTISLVASVNPVTVYRSVIYTAKVRPTFAETVNGTVTFMDGAYKVGEVRLEGNQAALSQTYNYVKTHPITAVYSGELNNAAGTISKTLIESVQINSTSTAIVSNLNPSIYGQPVKFTAIVNGRGPSPPTGKVLFKWKTYTIGSALLNSSGVATFTKSNLNAYAFPMFAVYNGDAYNLGSSSAVWNQIVTQTTSAATITSSLNPSRQGQPVSFVAKIVSPTVVPSGPVTFKAGATALATVQLSNGKAIFTTSILPAGSTVVKVIYEGNSNIKGSSASVTQTVKP